jgi:hypothetical protein
VETARGLWAWSSGAGSRSGMDSPTFPGVECSKHGVGCIEYTVPCPAASIAISCDTQCDLAAQQRPLSPQTPTRWVAQPPGTLLFQWRFGSLESQPHASVCPLSFCAQHARQHPRLDGEPAGIHETSLHRQRPTRQMRPIERVWRYVEQAACVLPQHHLYAGHEL